MHVSLFWVLMWVNLNIFKLQVWDSIFSQKEEAKLSSSTEAFPFYQIRLFPFHLSSHHFFHKKRQSSDNLFSTFYFRKNVDYLLFCGHKEHHWQRTKNLFLCTKTNGMFSKDEWKGIHVKILQRAEMSKRWNRLRLSNTQLQAYKVTEGDGCFDSIRRFIRYENMFVVGQSSQ